MTYEWSYKVGRIDKGDKEWFERMNKGFKVTGETLEETYREEQGRDGGSTTYVVMRGRFTPFGMCRDCGDHYIIAKWDKYIRVNKVSLERTIVVEDR